MVLHSFAYLAVIAVETLTVACAVLYAWRLRGKLREVGQVQSAKLSSTTAAALAHLIEECETPLTTELPEPEPEPVPAPPPPMPPARSEAADPLVLAEVRAACWAVAQHGRHQCSHHGS